MSRRRMLPMLRQLPPWALLLVLPVFWPALHGGFLFDDFPNLVHAEGWKAQSLGAIELWRAMHSDVSGSIGRPLSMLSFAFNHALTGLDPYWLKLTSLLWHLGNGLLVWLLCRRLLSALPVGLRPGTWVALLLAMAWLIHPLQVSTVMYTVQRMEIAAASGILLALLAYLVGRQRQVSALSGGWWLVLAVVAWCVGLGFKESALLAPAFALLLELTVLRFAAASDIASRRWKMGWLLAVVVAVTGWAMLAASQIAHWPHEFRGYGPFDRLLTQMPVLLMYLQQILWPQPESMVFYYDNFPVSRGLFTPWWTALAGLTLAGLALAAVLCRRRWPLTALGIGWFFVSHALTSNLWPLELAFEHRNYLALLGVVLALVQPLAWLGRRLNTDARAVLVMLPVLLLALLTHVQARTWADPMRLAWTLEGRNPDSPRASYALGQSLYAASGGQAGSPLWSMALRQFEHAAALPGDPVLPLSGQIQLLSRVGRTVPDTAWQGLRNALASGGGRPEHVGALYSLTQCRIQRLCAFDDSELLRTFLAVLERHPQQPQLLTMYANFAWNVLGDPALAINMQRAAVLAAPREPSMKVALAKFLLASRSAVLVEEGRGLLAVLRASDKAGLLERDIAELGELERTVTGAGGD